ncbi:VWA domain-containing protein [Deinococcus cellulosilyticus]|uniref:Tellurium resistance protein n=1 Tax=Deinococcus cellulosilyticus (strain DSM 18568 / NBRC 106333 / KACC 11606 / 5516J-15) TaxID=1223518 RepID=A0A511MWH1_DEIC1|nr:VWA domain-containing protein [Deinococcus cellulosilyticus]GEM44900.1 tellurium resistance protein [Deinococcus cellulosilyticus NBRC 106333 = KACC 11606]
MTQLTQGQRAQLPQFTSSLNLTIGIGIQGAGMTFDVSCFGVDQNDQLSDDRYFVFYNQKSSPEGALKLLGSQQGDLEQFQVDLSRLPSSIRKLVFAVTIDGNGVMSQIQGGHFRILEGGQEKARFNFAGQNFGQEKAVIVAEIYLKDVWRVLALGQGFAGGLSALLKNYGGQEADEPASPPPTPPAPTPPASQPAKPAVNLNKGVILEKKVQEKAPGLVSLVKTVNVILEKKQIADVVVKVVMVMDASGSMTSSYQNGTVQAVVDRVGVVAMRLDDDGALETWFYSDNHKQTPDVTLDSIHNYVKNNVKGAFLQIFKGLGVGNNEPPIMRTLVDRHKNSTQPVLVVFITDGGIYKTEEITRILKDCSHHPIFWQFIGVAGQNYGVLEKLDDLPGRVVDNADFFAVDDLRHISDDQLFERMLNELPAWLRAAKEKGILR